MATAETDPSPEAPPALAIGGVITAGPGSVVPPSEAATSAAEPTTAADVAVRAQSEGAAPASGDKEKMPPPIGASASILVIDIGGTKVKIMLSGQTEPRKAPSGKAFTPGRLVETVRELASDWEFDAISIGCPCLVGQQGPRSEPGNLGPGWVGFDYAAAFGKPVKMVNDAAMQALGSYEGGRMLFLGLGTGLGSALIAGQVIVPMELGNLPYDGQRRLGEVLGRAGMERIGKSAWREAVSRWVSALMAAFVADYVVVGGGNAKRTKGLPPGVRMGHNLTAFRGGFRLWSVEDAWVMATGGGESPEPTAREALRLI